MALFPETVAALLSGASVRAAWMFRFDFASETMRCWTGFGDLASGGCTWSGLGRAVQVSDLDLGPGLSGDPVELTLSGVDPAIAALALNQAAEVAGRRAMVYAQHFAETWAPLDAPILITAGVMDTMRVALTPTEGKIVLRLESMVATKYRPPYGNFTHFDQQQRYPGDRGLERVAHLVDHKVNWP